MNTNRTEQRKPRRKTHAGLLHNMSSAPKEQIRHRSPYRRAAGRGVIFAIPQTWKLPADLGRSSGLQGLTLPPLSSQEDELRRRIEAHARTLDLPAAAVVTDRAEPEDETCEDLLSVVTVLSKSSDRVYLRDKAPNLERLWPGMRVILIVPEQTRRSR